MTRIVGRPRKFQLRLSEDEEARWRAAAGPQQLSEFIRQAVEEKLLDLGLPTPAARPASIVEGLAALSPSPSGSAAGPSTPDHIVVAARERLEQISAQTSTRPHAPRCTCLRCQAARG